MSHHHTAYLLPSSLTQTPARELDCASVRALTTWLCIGCCAYGWGWLCVTSCAARFSWELHLTYSHCKCGIDLQVRSFIANTLSSSLTWRCSMQKYAYLQRIKFFPASTSTSPSYSKKHRNIILKLFYLYRYSPGLPVRAVTDVLRIDPQAFQTWQVGRISPASNAILTRIA